MITVGATILALFPLALEGGPLWKPLCYAQIGGLAVATFITLLLVPVFYAIFVLDLKWIKWETSEHRQESPDPSQQERSQCSANDLVGDKKRQKPRHPPSYNDLTDMRGLPKTA